MKINARSLLLLLVSAAVVVSTVDALAVPRPKAGRRAAAPATKVRAAAETAAAESGEGTATIPNEVL